MVFGMHKLISGMKRMLEELLESLESPGKKYLLQLRQEELAWFICNRAYIVCSLVYIHRFVRLIVFHSVALGYRSWKSRDLEGF